MAIFTEIWAADIKEKLFPSNTFLGQCIREDVLVKNNRVHHSESGDLPEVTIGQTLLPAAITKRTDIDLSYDVLPFRSKPERIERVEEIETNYSIRQLTLRNHVNQINRKMADFFPYAWAPNITANIKETTGNARIGSAPGATGQRKALKKEDILEVKLQMDSNDVPLVNRFILMPPQMLTDLLKDPQVLSKDYVETPNLVTGSVGRLYGFEIYVRSLVGRYGADSTDAKAVDATNEATDEAFALVWQKEQVRAALGDIKIFANENEPTLYGSYFSTESRAGGNRSFTDFTGVYSIREVTA